MAQAMKTRRTWQCNRTAFLKAWPGGYEENFAVYTPSAGLTEQEIVDTCLKPFYDPEGTALELGCGKGYWMRKYLLPNFDQVIGIDVIPIDWVDVVKRHDGFQYIGTGDYELPSVKSGSIDFIWSFGLFCHLSLNSIQSYLNSAYRVLKPGGHASLYFSNNDKRPAPPMTEEPDPDEVVGWTENDWPTTEGMLKEAGFTEIQEVLQHGKDTMCIVKK